MLQNCTPVIRLINGIHMMIIEAPVKEDNIINIAGLCPCLLHSSILLGRRGGSHPSLHLLSPHFSDLGTK
jgi:hypothetical protein